MLSLNGLNLMFSSRGDKEGANSFAKIYLHRLRSVFFGFVTSLRPSRLFTGSEQKKVAILNNYG